MKHQFIYELLIPSDLIVTNYSDIPSTSTCRSHIQLINYDYTVCQTLRVDTLLTGPIINKGNLSWRITNTTKQERILKITSVKLGRFSLLSKFPPGFILKWLDQLSAVPDTKNLLKLLLFMMYRHYINTTVSFIVHFCRCFSYLDKT